MIKMTKEQVLLLHTQLIEATGGSDGIRDVGLLESALESPFQSYGGEELYPSIQAKAARLCYGLVKNHAMIDGNKRIAAAIFLYFLDQNGILFDDGKKRIDDFALAAITIMIAESRPEEKELMVNLVMKCLI